MGPDARMSSDLTRESGETFARANEHLRLTAEKYEFDQAVPFLCECSEISCTEPVRLSLTSYRDARAEPGTYILLPGHEDPRTERIVDRRDGFALVEKLV